MPIIDNSLNLSTLPPDIIRHIIDKAWNAPEAGVSLRNASLVSNSFFLKKSFLFFFSKFTQDSVEWRLLMRLAHFSS